MEQKNAINAIVAYKIVSLVSAASPNITMYASHLRYDSAAFEDFQTVTVTVS